MLIFIVVLTLSNLFGGNSGSFSSVAPSSPRINNNNFDGSYPISPSSQPCGEYSYEFKLMHERDGHSSSSAIRRGNCKLSVNGKMLGYIYPSKAPELRIFWEASNGKVDYVD